MGDTCVAKQGGVLCLCHPSIQAAQPFTVSVSIQTCWGVLDALGPAALVVQSEELLVKVAAPVQPLHMFFLGVHRELVLGLEKCSKALYYRNSH